MITDRFASTLSQAATPTPATRAISSDFETFLKMLTAQLENQDPLNPVESSDYAVQLATFSGVEQQVLTNDLLKALGGQMGLQGIGQMADWVGREVRVAAPALFDGVPLKFDTTVPAGADRAELVVRNADGAVVQRLTIPVTGGPVDWAGVGSEGTPLARGTYAFEVAAYQGENAVQGGRAEHYARVSEVQWQDGIGVVVLPGGVTVPAAAVTAIRD